MKGRPENTRILVVEDSPTQAEVLRAILDAEGYRVEVARDGEEGWGRFKAGGIDLVLSDVVMPGLSGYDLCRRIKADPAGQDVPVIILTSLADPMDIIQGLEAGADNFITKPYEAGYLVSRIAGILAAREAVKDGGGEDKVRIGASISFLGRSVTITSAKQQILSLLVTTFEEAVRKSRELEAKQKELEQTNALLEEYARQAKGQARVSSEKYAILLEQASDGILLLDEQGCLVEANRQILLLTGFSREDAVGRHYLAFVPEPDREQRAHDFQEVLARGNLRVDAMRLLRACGGTAVVDLVATAVRLEGKVLVLMIARDATERVATERRFEVRRAAADALAGAASFDEAAPRLLESMCVALGWHWAVIWRMDEARKGLVFQASWAPPGIDLGPYLRDASAAVFGRGDGLPGRAWELGKVIWIPDISRQEELARSAPVMRRVLDAGIRMSVTIPIVCEGSVVAVMILGRREPGEPDERLIRTFMNLGDHIGQYIDRKRAEEALRESENLYRTLVSALPDAVTMTDLEGRVLYSSPRALELYGFAGLEETIGIKSFELIAPEDRERAGRNLGKTIAEGRIENAEYALLRKDGTRFPGELSAAVVKDAGGKPKAFIAITRDVSARKRLEEQYRQAQKMEAIGRLASGVAHDFNNLITVIMGFSDLLLEKVTEEGVIRQRIGQIRTAAEHAATLTKQLLAFSRRQVLEPRRLNLGNTVAGMEQMIRRLVGENVESTFKVDPAAGMVMADPGQISQVVMNLAVNARDAMPDGGNLLIEVANADLGETDIGAHSKVSPGPYVMLAVSDTGTGIDAETKARIFEPFFTTKETDAGTGLGLSTAFGIIQQSGGTISVYSEPGRGSTFKAYLPRIDGSVAAAAEPIEPEATRARRSTATILVVEDEAAVRELVREILAGAGHHIVVAATPEDAIALTGEPEGRADLLLTDMIMPGMTGRELASRLQAKSADLRVLFMSGCTATAAGGQQLLSPGDAFIQKPFAPAALLEKVREVLA